MNWRTYTALGLTGLVVACGRGDETATPADTSGAPPATPPAAATTPTPATTPQTGPAAARPAARTPAQAPVAPAMMDEPWTPTDTGTVSPGMTREQVVAVWGAPVAERAAGEWMYLFYRNGCEVSCGTFDVVLLQGGQVVDAIVRGRGHTYAGSSSSPPGREATPTPPGTATGTT